MIVDMINNDNDTKTSKLVSLSSWRDITIMVVIALSYFLAHQLAFLFPDSENVLMALWPAGGIGLAALLLNPRRRWPAIAVVLFIAGNLANVLDHRPLLGSLGFMTANVTESLGCAWLITGLCGDRVRFDRGNEVLVLAIGAIFVNAFTACIGAGTATCLTGTAFFHFWRTWWSADGLSILIIAPLIVSSWRLPLSQRKPDLKGIVELFVFLVAWCAVVYLTCTRQGYFRPYMPVILLTWVAMRMGQSATLVALALQAGIALVLAAKIVPISPWSFENPHVIMFITQVYLGCVSFTGMLLAASFAESKAAAQSARESEEKFAKAFQTAPHIMCISRMEDGAFLDVNKAFTTVTGYTREEAIDSSALWLKLWVDEKHRRAMVAALRSNQPVVDMESLFKTKTGRIITGLVSCQRISLNNEEYILSNISDISARKQMENRHELSTNIIGILYSRDSLKKIINGVLLEIKKETGFDAVGIRLKSGTDFPYFAHDGFSGDFMLTENTLVERGKDGSICMGKDGNVSLECTCGLVVSGKTDPASPLFTCGGSFWTNNSPSLLEIPGDKDPRIHPRNRCIHDQYVSVALIPIREGRKIVGLLQLNDHDKDSLTLDMIHFYEGVGASIGAALMEKEAEEALRESNERFRLSMDATNDGIWDWNIETDGGYFSPNYYRMLGYEVGAFPMQGKAWSELLHPDDRANTIRANMDCIEGRCETFQIEYRMKAKNGEWRWILARGKCVNRDEQGRATRMVGTHVDITGRREMEDELRQALATRETSRRVLLSVIEDQKKAEEALQSSEEKYRSLIENSHDVIYTLGVDGVLTFVSPAWTALLGHPVSQVIGQSFQMFVHPEDVAGCMAFLKNVIETGQRQEGVEYRIRHADGSWRWHTSSVVPVKSATGSVISFEAICRDITDAKLADQNIRDLNSQMKEASSMAIEMAVRAEAANVAKSQFLANMSHEIRTPLNGIIGISGLLQETALSGEQRRYVQMIQSSGEILTTVIGDVLDFSKIEADKMELETVAFDLNEVIRETTHMLSLQAVRKGLNITSSIEQGTMTHLSGDPIRLRQILLNLGSNAIKFTAHGEVTIAVSLVDENAGKTPSVRLRFSVHDSGIGIPKERIGILFNPFQQVDASTTRKYGGTGLGLAISKRLAEMMGGEIGVESVEGKGSTFWFTVVLVKATGMIEGPRNASVKTRREKPAVLKSSDFGMIPTQEVQTSLHDIRVLLAEDDAINTEVAMGMLKKLHCEIDCATDGNEAVLAFGKKHYDIVLMDVQMPVVDGLEATQRIREYEAAMDHHVGSAFAGITTRKNEESAGEDATRGVSTRAELQPGMSRGRTPIVAITAHSSKDYRAICLQADMDDYITKPVNMRELSRILHKWCSGKVRRGAQLSGHKTTGESGVLDTTAAFDVRSLMSRLMDDSDLAGKVVSAFLTDMPKQIAILRQHVAHGEAELAGKQAHKIKGSAANVSGAAVSTVARRMEDAGGAGKMEGMPGMMKDLESRFDELKSEMEEWRRTTL